MSFRIRLFASAVLTVLAVLSVVMTVAWLRIVDVESARLEAGLCNEASRVAMERFPEYELGELEADIVRKLRLGSPDAVLLKYQDRRAGRSYQSASWSTAVPADVGVWSAPRAPQAEPPPRPDERPPRPDLAPRACNVESFERAGSTWQIARVTAQDAVGWVAANMQAPAAEVRQALVGGLRFIVPMAVVLTGVAAWLLSNYLMRPIRRLQNAMKTVTPSDLDLRLHGEGEDQEFSELIACYNRMLERLERSFHQASRFSSDAAHELRTPLTVLRGSIESLRRNTNDPDTHAKLSGLMDEVSRLASITRKLLLLSQADAGKLELHRLPLDLTALLTDLVADAQMACDAKTLNHSVASGLRTPGDVDLLRQMLNNLLSNALRYSPPDALVVICAQAKGATIEIDVSNTSAPIGQPQRDRFFDRFYRGEDLLTRSIDGCGLGLSLAREIARAHGGSLELLPTQPTVVAFRVTLAGT